MEERIYTGCTLLDLVVGGGKLGFEPGRIINVVGDKSAGKSFLCAELVANNFHRLGDSLKYNYDDGETGYTFDSKALFNMDMAPKGTLTSRRVQDFDTNTLKFLNGLKDNQIGIYVLDSLDGVSNIEVENRAEARLKAAEAGKEFKEGSYNTETAAFLSKEFFKTKTAKFEEKNSLLIIISQIRQNLDPFSFKKYTRSGGEALNFYAHTVLYLAVLKKIERNGRAVGVLLKAKTTKSKTPRPYRECVFSLYFDYGIDDIGSNLDYLFDLRTDKGELKKTANQVYWDSGKSEITVKNIKGWLESNKLLDVYKEDKQNSSGNKSITVGYTLEWLETQSDKIKKTWSDVFGLAMSRDDLIQIIDSNPEMKAQLKERVIQKWEEAEAEIKTNRVSKYGRPA